MCGRKGILFFAVGFMTGISSHWLWQITKLASPSSFSPQLLEVNRAFLGGGGGSNDTNWQTHQVQEDGFREDHQAENETDRLKTEALVEEALPKLRLLCWIMTNPANHDLKAKHVLATWAKRCDKTILMSSAADEALGAVEVIHGKESRGRLYEKTKAAFKYVYEHHLDDADWFLKADDDTYVVVENLRHFLEAFNSSAPLYFGRRLYSRHYRVDYMSGGGGYVLSREAVKKLVEEGLSTPTCRQDGAGSEDLELGRCLKNAGVFTGDSRDADGRERFFPHSPVNHVVPLGRSHWLQRFNFHHMIEGLKGVSDTAVSFHYIRPDEMYALEYLLYSLRLHGVRHEELLRLSLSPLNDELPREAFQRAAPNNGS